MIKLNYQTNNPRWGLSGIKYSSWIDYAFSLGYLSNINHYHNVVYDGLIELHVEGNEQQGAWDKEGRIHYYGDMSYLETYFFDWYNNCSAGRQDITCRINSNEYLKTLINDYCFVVKTYRGKTTWDVFPPENDPYNTVLSILLNIISNQDISQSQLEDAFNEGWDLG